MRQMYDMELEQEILSMIIIDKNCIEIAVAEIDSDFFISNEHKILFETAKEMSENNEPIDIINLKNKVIKNGKIEAIGGEEYIWEISRKFVTSGYFNYKLKLLKEQKQTFELNKLIKKASDDLSKNKLINYNEMKEKLDFMEILTETKEDIIKIKDVGLELISSLEDGYKNWQDGKPSKRKKTDFMDLEKLTNGFGQGELVIIGARPAMGKSAFLLNLAKHLAEKTRIAYFTLEMSSEETTIRLINSLIKINPTKFKEYNFEDEDWFKIADALSEIAEYKINISDKADITFLDIKKICSKLKRESGLDIIFIDYLQILNMGKAENRNLQIADVTRKLKILARELKITIITAVQLSRSCEQRQNKRPMLSDIRESGAIEQDADMVMFLYRDEYYNPATENKGVTEVIVAKNRSGAVGTAYLGFKPEHSLFYNIEIQDQNKR